MFCWKCGEPIDDGEELCKVCSAKKRQGAVDEADEADETVKKVMGKVAGKVGEALWATGKVVADSALKEVKETMLKKAKKETHRTMVKLKLAKETPLDKAEKIWKKIKK